MLNAKTEFSKALINKKIVPLGAILVIMVLFIAYNVPRYFEMLSVLAFFSSLILFFFLIPEYNRNKSITILLLSVCVFLKYILTPLFYCIAPITSFSNFTPTSLSDINVGIALMLYEMIVVSFVSIIFTRYYSYKLYSSNFGDFQYLKLLKNKNLLLVLYFLFTLLIIVVYPMSIQGLSFGFLQAGTMLRKYAMGESSSIQILLQQIVLFGFFSMFVAFSTWCANKYLKKHNKIYVYMSLLFAIVITMIIIGEARSSQIYCGYACAVLLTKLFPQNKKVIQRSLLLTVFIVISLLTIYKSFYAFQYSNYFEAVSASTVNYEVITGNFESYCLGPLHYTSVIELDSNNYYSFTFDRLIFGFLRSVMGTNLLVKDLDMETTSMVYNEFISGNMANTGHLLPITGLGYLYFPFVFAPLLTCFMYKLASKVEFLINKSGSAFGVFFLSYVYIRLATCIVFSNINTILTVLSMVFWLSGIVYILNKTIRSS